MSGLESKSETTHSLLVKAPEDFEPAGYFAVVGDHGWGGAVDGAQRGGLRGLAEGVKRIRFAHWRAARVQQVGNARRMRPALTFYQTLHIQYRALEASIRKYLNI